MCRITLQPGEMQTQANDVPLLPQNRTPGESLFHLEAIGAQASSFDDAQR